MKKQTTATKNKAVAKNIVNIDATGKILGRLATEIAHILQEKDRADFVFYKDTGVSVSVENVGKMIVTGKKMEDKLYWRYSGYPGGIRSRTMGELWAKDPTEVLRKAIYGMLPKNKLRKDRLRRLKMTK